MDYLILILLLVLVLEVYAILLKLYKELETTKTEEPKSVELTEDQLQEFLEADKTATKNFYSTLANLNSFMTGIDYEEEVNNVGQQDR